MPIIIGSFVRVVIENEPNTATAINSQTNSFKIKRFIVPCFCAKVGVICATYLHSNKKIYEKRAAPVGRCGSQLYKIGRAVYFLDL